MFLKILNATTSADLDNELGVTKIFKFSQKAGEWLKMVVTEYPHYIFYGVVALSIIIILKLIAKFSSKKYVKNWDKAKKEFKEQQERGEV